MVRETDTTRVKGEVHFEDMVQRDVLEKQYVQPMKGATPDVSNKRIFEGANTGAVNVTDFINGSLGQRLFIRGDGQMTIINSAIILTNTGANKLLAVNKVYKFTYFERIVATNVLHVWVEDE